MDCPTCKPIGPVDRERIQEEVRRLEGELDRMDRCSPEYYRTEAELDRLKDSLRAGVLLEE